MIKKSILLMLLASTTLASCEKYETPTPQSTRPSSQTGYDYRAFYLDVQLLNVSLTNHKSFRTNPLVGSDYNNTQVGWLARFADTTATYSVQFDVFMDMNKNVTQMWGVYNGKTFILHEGCINICGGVQGAPITFSIR
jgi:hypothetical protein